MLSPQLSGSPAAPRNPLNLPLYWRLSSWVWDSMSPSEFRFLERTPDYSKGGPFCMLVSTCTRGIRHKAVLCTEPTVSGGRIAAASTLRQTPRRTVPRVMQETTVPVCSASPRPGSCVFTSPAWSSLRDGSWTQTAVCVGCKCRGLEGGEEGQKLLPPAP